MTQGPTDQPIPTPATAGAATSAGNAPGLDPEEPQVSRAARLGRFGAIFVSVFCVAAAGFHVYSLGVQHPGILNLRALHLLVALVLVPLLYGGWRAARDRFHWSDLILIAGGLASTIYVIIEGPQMVWRYGVSPTELDLLFGGLLIVLILEITRRTVGWPLVIVVLVLLLYALFGSHFPGILQTRSFSLRRSISFLFSLDGIYGIPIGVSSTYIYLFILFGAMLRFSRAGDFYMNLAYSVAGRSRGGPAKVSIFASALFGTISGTGIANVVTTGALTIPLMKRAGFKATFAGAVESVASTGGQIMPPIMGAGAFLMAEFIRIPYGDIVIAAILPALLFFVSVYLIVDIEATRSGLRGLKASELPKVVDVMRRWGHLSVPILVLLYMLIVENVSPIRAALFAMGTILIVSWIRQETRLGALRLINTAVEGTKGTLEVIASCAAAGLITGLIQLTGLGLRLSSWLAGFADGNLIFALVLTMIVTIILSMGLPTTAAYIVSAAVLAPALVALGISPLQAHFFIFYFACLSGITPPVALVAIPAGSIAGANTFAVSLKAFQLALTAFMIPYFFVYSPELLLQGTFGVVALATISGLVGVWGLANALGGYTMRAPIAWTSRLLLGAGALVLIAPGLTSDAIGLSVMAVALALHRQRSLE
jgi:TRAP transporter 4TM/12TM fusion protein